MPNSTRTPTQEPNPLSTSNQSHRRNPHPAWYRHGTPHPHHPRPQLPNPLSTSEQSQRWYPHPAQSRNGTLHPHHPRPTPPNSLSLSEQSQSAHPSPTTWQPRPARPSAIPPKPEAHNHPQRPDIGKADAHVRSRSPDRLCGLHRPFPQFFENQTVPSHPGHRNHPAPRRPAVFPTRCYPVNVEPPAKAGGRGTQVPGRIGSVWP